MTDVSTPLELILEERVTLGAGAAPPGSFTDRVVIGRPLVATVDVADLPAERRRYAAGDRRFATVELPVSFVHDDDNPFESAWLQVALTQDSDGDGWPPVGRWLEPSVVSSTVAETHTTKLGTSKILMTEHNQQTTSQRTLISLEALYEGTAQPTWSFTRTRHHEIRGRHTLTMAVEHAPTGTVTASVSIGATIRVRRLGIFSYTVPSDPTRLDFQVHRLP